MTEIQEIVISADKQLLNVDFVCAMLAKQYWCLNVPRAVVERAIAHSQCFGVYLKDSMQQIGFARVVTDCATFAYLADVFIEEEHRGNGYAKQLVSGVKAHPSLQGLRRWMLMTRDAHDLYKQFGFTALAHPDRAMELFAPSVYQSTNQSLNESLSQSS